MDELKQRLNDIAITSRIKLETGGYTVSEIKEMINYALIFTC